MTTTATGEEARDRGAETVLSAATAPHRIGGAEALRKALDDRIDHSATTGEPFTAEDVRRLAGNPETHSPNVLPALFAGAVRAGRIRQVGHPVRATRRERHAGLVRRWQAVRRDFGGGDAA